MHTMRLEEGGGHSCQTDLERRLCCVQRNSELRELSLLTVARLGRERLYA